MASSSQWERKGLKEDQETESSISKTIQWVGRGGAVDVELRLDGGARGEGLADERSFRRTSRDEAGMMFSRAPPYSCSYSSSSSRRACDPRGSRDLPRRREGYSNSIERERERPSEGERRI